MSDRPRTTADLPIASNLAPFYVVSWIVAGLMVAASAAGLLFRSVVYPTDELVKSFVPNDVVNLFIGVPVLLCSMGLAWRGKLLGLLLWPGALLFILYDYLAYIFGLPFNALFLLSLLIVTISVYVLIVLVASIDGEAVRGWLAGAVPEKSAGGILTGLGILFALRATGTMIGALVNHTPIASAELSLLVSDFMITGTWIIGGVLLWRRNALGYTAGLGLLFQASMLFIGLIVYLILQPMLTGAAFAPVDILVVFLMGMICFIPFALFLRGAVAGRNSSSV